MARYVVSLTADSGPDPDSLLFNDSKGLLQSFLAARDGTLIEMVDPLDEGIARIEINPAHINELGKQPFVEREHASPIIGTDVSIQELALTH